MSQNLVIVTTAERASLTNWIKNTGTVLEKLWQYLLKVKESSGARLPTPRTCDWTVINDILSLVSNHFEWVINAPSWPKMKPVFPLMSTWYSWYFISVCVCVCLCPDPFPLVCPHSHVVDWMDFWTLGCSLKHFVTLKVMINHLHLLMSLKIYRVELKSMF